MKLCSVVLFAVLVALASAFHGKGKGFMEMHKKCMDENKVDMETMKSNMGKEEPETKVKCVSACLCQAMKIMNADGSPNQAGADEMITKMPEKMQERMKKNMDECMKLMKAGLPECESGYKYTKCLREKMGHGKGKEFMETKKQCMKENGVDAETMKSNKDTADPPTNVKCVTDCMYQKMKIIKADGSFDQAAADAQIAKMPEKKQEKMKTAMNECKTVAKAGMAKCESGFQYAKCMHEKMPQRKHKKEKKEKKDSDGEA